MNLDDYLTHLAKRLGWRRRALGLMLLTAAVGGATLVGGWLVMTAVPSVGMLLTVRVLLGVAFVCAAALLIAVRWRPDRVARQAESTVPHFDGRLVTWLDQQRRGGGGLLPLLEIETRAIAARHPPAALVPTWQIVAPACVAAALLIGIGGWLAGAGPWPLAAQRLWAGDWLADAAPRIVVRPGDVVVRRGSDVVIEARAHGFAPAGMALSAAFGDAPWEQAAMTDAGDGAASFVFVGVTEDVSYYVSDRGIASHRHRIEVADLPEVTGVRATLIFPDWTRRAEQAQRGGDVSAIAGTEVRLHAVTDRPVDGARLVINGESRPMKRDGDTLTGAFELQVPGEWYVAIPHGGSLARISDTYAVEPQPDQPPEVTFEWPGEDRQATPIEEVDLAFSATDDFAVESLTMRYAVNGGEWAEVALNGEPANHTLALETLVAQTAGDQRPLQPGDVISFYGEARDHAQSRRSALYFVDVRPFENRYRESQQMAGQGSAEGGAFEISQRQRDILSATWNLINDHRDGPAGPPGDQAEVLSMLQQTLREQVATVVARAAARGLGGDRQVGGFVEALTRAIEPMDRAARQLADLELEQAVGAEQTALAALVSAEASVRDVDVSLSRGDGRGTSGRSLGELIELEMDQARNRYEMPQQAGAAQSAGADQDPAWQRLDELAARQQRLARRQDQAAPTLAERWEQARLEREIDELRRELEEVRSPSSGGQRAEGRQGGGQAGLQEALAGLERAQQALRRQGLQDDESAGERAANPSVRDADRSGRFADAAELAGDALRQAALALREDSRGDLGERLARAGRRVANLQQDQQRVREALDELQSTALERARNGDGGLARSDYGMHTFADVKRRMQRELAALRGDLSELGGALAETGPRAAARLDEALREVDEARVDERLAAAAEAFEYGQPLYVIGSESLVDQALDRLALRVAQADEAMQGQWGGATADPLEQVRNLRRRLDEARTAGGDVRPGEVEAVARAAGRLSREVNTRSAASASAAGRSAFSAGSYSIRGTSQANTEALFRLTAEQLDLLESGLELADEVPIRAQQARDADRDSDAAARYFRELSRRGEP